MMLNYFLNHLTGVWAMAFDREGWDQQMDKTVDGVFRSFALMIPCFVIVLTLSFILTPIYAELDIGVNGEPATLAVVPGVILILIKFLAEWVLSLLFLLSLANRLGEKTYAVDVILGYNWLQMMTKLLLAFPVLLLAATKSIELSSFVTLPTFILVLAMTWGVLRRALPNVLPAITAGMMVGLFIINSLIQLIFQMMSQPFLLQTTS